MIPQEALPPHNIEAEQAVLGGLLMNNNLLGLITSKLKPEDFFEPLHGHILHQSSELILAGQKATPLTLKDCFPDIEIVQGINLRQYLARLLSEGLTIDIGYLCDRVRELSRMRGVIRIADDLRRSAGDGLAPEQALASTWERLDELRHEGSTIPGQRGSIATLAPLLLEVDEAQVAPTGLLDWDRAIAGGLRAGRLYILAGRPGMGKTVLGVSASRRISRKGVGVSIFSLEIDTREILARMAADEMSHSHLPIPYRDMVSGFVDDGSDGWKADRARVAEVIGRLQKYPLQVDSSGGLSIHEIESRARIDRDKFLKEGKRLGVVVIDYLGLIKATERYRGNRVHEMGEIALGGKTMAKRLDCAVVMLAQLNRGVEQRDDKRPTMSDLRDSGNIEEHADFVGLLYRPFYYIEKSQGWRDQLPEVVDKGIALRDRLELIIGKNRLGSTEIVNLWCNPALSAVDNLSRYG